MSKTVIQSLKDYIQFLEKMSDKEFIEFHNKGVEEAKKNFPDFMEERADEDNASEMLELRDENTRLRSLLGECLEFVEWVGKVSLEDYEPERIDVLWVKIENELKGE